MKEPKTYPYVPVIQKDIVRRVVNSDASVYTSVPLGEDDPRGTQPRLAKGTPPPSKTLSLVAISKLKKRGEVQDM